MTEIVLETRRKFSRQIWKKKKMSTSNQIRLTCWV